MALSVPFLFSWAAQPGTWGPASLSAGFLYRILSSTRLIPNCSIGGLRAHSAGSWLSLPHLITDWLNFPCTELYNSSTHTFFLWASQIALIQLSHGQGYTLLIPRPDAPVIYTGAVPILTARPGRRSIYNTWIAIYIFMTLIILLYSLLNLLNKSVFFNLTYQMIFRVALHGVYLRPQLSLYLSVSLLLSISDLTWKKNLAREVGFVTIIIEWSKNQRKNSGYADESTTKIINETVISIIVGAPVSLLKNLEKGGVFFAFFNGYQPLHVI